MLTSLELGLTANSGLAATAQLVQLLGGRIAVSSEEGKGSIFSLAIPVGLNVRELSASPSFQSGRHPAVNSTQDSTRGSGTAGCCGHVLLVEDLPPTRRWSVCLLETMGLKVSLAENGQQASIERW